MSGFSRGAQELQSGKALLLTGPPREAERGIAYAVGNPAETYRPVNGTDRIAPEGPAISAIAGPVSLRPAPLPTSYQIFRARKTRSRLVLPQNLVPIPLRLQDQLDHLAHRPAAARRHRNVMRLRLHLRARVGGSDGQPHAVHYHHIRQIVADIRPLFLARQ